MLNGSRFSSPFFFVGRAWLFQPFFFSFSPIIIFHYSLITTINIIIYILFISLSVEGQGIAVAPWRLASKIIIIIIILLHLRSTLPPLPLQRRYISLFFFLTPSPHQHFFQLHLLITPPPSFDASASIEVLQG